jgi:serine phosphatase RsbU (regulator of sigma subunit)
MRDMTSRRAQVPIWVPAALAVLLSATAPGAVAGEVVIVGEKEIAHGLSLQQEWRYRAGDDPSWADAETDDSAWPVVSSRFLEPDDLAGGWQGIGWFRTRLRLAPQIETAHLGLHMNQAGASEVYLDGDLVARFGSVADTAGAEIPVFPRNLASFDLTPGVDHVLAVRYSNRTGHEVGHEVLRPTRGFSVTLSSTEGLSGYFVRLVRDGTAHRFATIGIFTALAVVHLLLFAFSRQHRDHLLFAAFAGSVAASLFARASSVAAPELATVLFFYKIAVTFTVFWAVIGIFLELRTLRDEVRVRHWVLFAAGAAVLVELWSWSTLREPILLKAYLVVVAAEMIWLATRILSRGRSESWVVGAGFSLLAIGVGADILDDVLHLGVINSELPYYLGLMAGAVSLSLYLSRDFARTNRRLEVKLEEVHELTARTIEQERRAATEEAERLVLAADNRRKTEELERARELQLAMLPPDRPRHADFDVAFRMVTASEVGGDYYDFVEAEDGALTVVVADATGHGLHAGMVVSVAKSVFRTCDHHQSLTSVLQRIAAGLESFHQRLAGMAMVLFRLETGGLRFVSAGMPPLLVWRDSAREVEEHLVPAVPLATMDGANYTEQRIALEPGDTVLATSDGLAEIPDRTGEPFGYDRIRDRFAAIAERDAEAIVDALFEDADSLLEGSEPQDDITIVVVKTV